MSDRAKPKDPGGEFDPAEISEGPGLSVLVELTATLGRMVERQKHDDQRRYHISLIRNVPLTPVVYSGAALAAAQTTDARDLYGPKDFYAWDLRFTQVAATGGTFDVYLNQPSLGGTSDPNSLVHIAAAGFNQTLWGSGIKMLYPGDRLVFVIGTGATLATFSGTIIQVPLPLVGEYLM